MSHIFRNPLLCIPSQAQLHADLIPHLDTLTQLADTEDGGVRWADFADLGENFGQAARLIHPWGPGVFSAPVFSPEFCAALVAEFADAKMAVNPDEDEPYQIPELVLREHALALYGSLAVHFDRVLQMMGRLLFHFDSPVITTIQLAKYKPTEVGHGNWHTDRDSDFTAVVALSDTHTGGGTEVRALGLGEPLVVPQLPVGHAMLFCGKTHLHRGMPVHSGVRNLLVFWSEVN